MSPPSLMLFPVATQAARWGTRTVALRPSTRSCTTDAVKADARLAETSWCSTLSMLMMVAPSISSARMLFSHYSLLGL